VSGATNYQVFRTEGIKKCSQGKVKLTTTKSLSFTDTGLMNGREYYYIVIAKGPSDSCFGPSSPCMTVIPTEAPVPTTPSPTKKPSPPTRPPTISPTRKCGNSVCEINEFAASCPVDCSNRELSVLADTTSKGAPGVMFWVAADSRDVDVSSFQFYTTSTRSEVVQIYIREGKSTGFEINEAGWELVFEQTVSLNGAGSLTELSLLNKVTIPSGGTKSFFIWIDNINVNSIKYEAGTAEGALLNSDSFIKFYEGVGITRKFAGSYNNVWNPRRFSGIIRCV
jgi:hypothetical protein